MRRIIEFWLQLGVSGFRVDAAPFLIEPVRAGDERPGPRFGFLHELREHLSWRRGDAILLGEANVERDAPRSTSASAGCTCCSISRSNQQPVVALAREDAARSLGAAPRRPAFPHRTSGRRSCATTTSSTSGASRRRARGRVRGVRPVAYAALWTWIRRRLAPMLGNDRRRLELALSLLVALPGTPVLRTATRSAWARISRSRNDAVRTAMQWNAGPNGGFSDAPASAVEVPVVRSGAFAYSKVNVAAQERDEQSLLRWLVATLRIAVQCPELAEGAWEALDTGERSVVALRHRLDGSELLTLHNLAATPRRVRVDLGRPKRLLQLHADGSRPRDPRGSTIDLAPYGYRWLRVQRQGS